MKGTNTELLERSYRKVADRGSNGWGMRHHDAFVVPHTALELGLTQMLRGVARYADAYQKRFDSPVGTDYVLGDEGVLPVLVAIHRLLDGELDRLDGGTLSSLLISLAQNMGFPNDKLEDMGWQREEADAS